VLRPFVNLFVMFPFVNVFAMSPFRYLIARVFVSMLAHLLMINMMFEMTLFMHLVVNLV